MSKAATPYIRLSGSIERVVDEAEAARRQMNAGLIPDDLLVKLIENGRHRETDHWPVVKLYTPDAQCTWLLTELDEDGDTLFGLADLGMQCPELGYVSLAELESVRGKLGLPIERDLHFTSDRPLSQYTEAARRKGYIDA